ncbi:copper resistance system multicopper oxidase [Pseudomonas sp. UBA6310]|uniref:copper resistance system multicopper oxidase n=1 Tax=Pseudomonas sp. UBA6310 TaxID=1947327 RepID=UPI0025794350|nr:copper resistance system multicopper oxidase [Pseudomonas sp. UBA6310]
MNASFPALSRRRFVQGLGAGGALALAGGWPQGALAQAVAPSPRQLSGNRFELEIAEQAVNYTGRAALATTVNGSLPAPTLRWRQGEEVSLRVTNRLAVPSSIHWHGILLPADMDGVPGISFAGIAPGETFTYRFRVLQAGTYWYHGHSGFQEQTGLYGALLVEPEHGEPLAVERDYTLMLSDWTDEDPMRIFGRLKADSEYFARAKPSVAQFARDVENLGLAAAWDRRAMWNRMRMSPTDLQDVSGATYTYLVNGATPAANWTAIAEPGERVRLRFINAGTSTYFDVRIPGLPLTVVATDGQAVAEVTVDEFRIAPGETYDVLVRMPDAQAYSIFCQSMDRSGYARATLAPVAGMQAAVPRLDPPVWLDMRDMGHGEETMAGMEHMAMSGMDHGSMAGMDHAAMPASAPLPTSAQVDMRVANPSDVLDDPGPRLRGNGRRVLTYADLSTLGGGLDPRPPTRDLVLRLTGNMQRFVWGFDGLKYNEAEPIPLRYGERLRLRLINDTMMNHPIHLHGMFFEVENEASGVLLRKHTVNVQPGKQVALLVSADAPGEWAFHCHLLYHMEAGMFRKVVVA